MPIAANGAYYTLGEPAGSTAAGDTSGNQASSLTIFGSGAAVVFGSLPGPPGSPSLSPAQFNGGQYLAGSFPGPTVPSPLMLVVTRTGTPATAETVFTGFGCDLVIETSGKLSVYRLGSLEVQTAGSICDGDWHLPQIAGWLGNGSFRVDGAAVGTWGSLGAGLSFPARVGIGGGGGRTTLTGTIGHVALGSSASDSVIYQAVTTAFAGESGTARITRLAGYAGIPIGTMDPSLTNMPGA